MNVNQLNQFKSDFGIENGKKNTGGPGMNQTMVEFINPCNESDDDDGLGAWAGNIGMKNKI